MDFIQLWTHRQCFGPFFRLFLHCQLSTICRWHLARLPSLHCRRLANSLSMINKSCCTHRLIVDVSQTTSQQLHGILFSIQQPTQTSAMFSVATIDLALATTCQCIRGISTFDHWLFGRFHVTAREIDPRQQTLTSVCCYLLPFGKKKKIGNRRHVAADFYATLALENIVGWDGLRFNSFPNNKILNCFDSLYPQSLTCGINW